MGALSTTGAGPTTWPRAAEENGLPDGKIVIISMDYTRPNLGLVKQGKVFGLVGQPLVEEFRQCVHIVDKVLRGEPTTMPTRCRRRSSRSRTSTRTTRTTTWSRRNWAPERTPPPRRPQRRQRSSRQRNPMVKMTPQEMGCKHGKDGKCRVVLSNSFIGNDWRIQMQNTAKAAASADHLSAPSTSRS